MEFGLYFKRCRRKSGKTQKQVAEYLGVCQSSVSDWESNISRPDYEKLLELAKFYDVTVSELLGQEHIVGLSKNI